MVQGELSGSISIELVASVLYFSLKTVSCSFARTLEVQMLKEVSLSRVLDLFVARPSLDEHTNGRHLRHRGLSHHSDAVRNSGQVELSVVLEGLGHFSEREVAEISELALLELRSSRCLHRGRELLLEQREDPIE